MITFLDGPAQGQRLALRRAPIMLRVVRSPAGEFDGLDQPLDAPEPGDEVFAYMLVGNATSVHICNRGHGQGQPSGWLAIATYKQLPFSVPDEHLRDTVAWARWCDSNRELLLNRWAGQQENVT